MASTFTQQSPEVVINEVDLTNIVGTAGAASGAFAGDFAWGPAEQITTVSSPVELEAQFGKPNDVNYADWFSAFNFLAYTGTLHLVRAIDDDAINASDDGNGLLIKNSQHFQVVSTAPTSVRFAAKYPGALGNSISVHIADAATFDGWAYADLFDFAPGTSEWAAALGVKNDEVHVVVVDELGQFTGTVGAVLEQYAFASKALDAKDGNNAFNFYGNVLNRSSQYVYSLDVIGGSDVANATTGSVDSVTVTAGGSGYTTATVVFSAPQTPGGVTATGTVTVAGGEITGVTITNPGSGYTSAPTVTFSGSGGSGATGTANLEVDANSADWGTNGVVAGVAANYKSLVTALDLPLTGGANSTAVTADELIAALELFGNAEEVDVSLLFLGPAGGSSEHTAVVQYAIDNLAEKRRDLIVFFSPKLDDVLNKTQSAATAAAIATRNQVGRSSSYAVMDSGWKFQYDVYNDKYRWVPLNADTAGLCAQVDNTSDPWNSPGGYTRGRLKNVVSLAFNPNKSSRDALYKVGINPIVTFNTDGTILYGDKTLLGKNSAFSQIGTRRLFIVLEKATSQAAKYFLFENNTPFTRASFVNMVEPYIQEMIGRGGIQDGRVVCDASNNTPQVVMNRQFVGSFFIKPNYSVNWIKLNFVAVRQDVAFEEVVGGTF